MTSAPPPATSGPAAAAALAVAERRAAVAEAGHTGDRATALAARSDPDPGVRATALGALRRLGTLSPADLLVALADPSPIVRRRAAEEVAADDPGPTVSLLGLLDDPDPTVIEVAAWGCGERTPPEPGAVAALTRLVDHDDALVREAAVASLGAIGDPAGLPAILAATRDRATVRRRAVIALAPFDGPEVDAALERATTDRDWQVRQAAEDPLRAAEDLDAAVCALVHSLADEAQGGLRRPGGEEGGLVGGDSHRGCYSCGGTIEEPATWSWRARESGVSLSGEVARGLGGAGAAGALPRPPGCVGQGCGH